MEAQDITANRQRKPLSLRKDTSTSTKGSQDAITPTRTQLILGLCLFRLANTYLVQTYIHPDETWQSLEIAHHLVFGYGFVTWEWFYALRGYAHPMLFAVVYKALQVLRIDDTFLILAAPYMLVALTAAAIDYATYSLTSRVAGHKAATWALFCSVISCTMASGIVRPLVNSAETAFCTAGFALWPWHKSGGLGYAAQDNTRHASLIASLVFAAVGCIIRPTSGIIWLCAGLVLIISQPASNRFKRTAHILLTSLSIGLLAISLMLIIDRAGYGMWVLPPVNFYRFNVEEGLATWFGESNPFYHLYVSIPIMFTTTLPFVLHGVYVALRYKVASIEPAVVAVVASFAFSLVGHMEYRFLYPLLPIGFMYSGVSLGHIFGALPVISSSHPHAKPNVPQLFPGRNVAYILSKCTWRRIVAFLFATNIPIALYLDLVHQRGVVDVIGYLRSEANKGAVQDVGFLMPCHSTPFYSHMHKNIPMWFLSCEPPLTRSELTGHYWEADDFEQNPVEFVKRVLLLDRDGKETTHKHMGNDHPMPGTPRSAPSHLVLYDCMVQRISNTLEALSYCECARFFNTHFNGDSRRKGDVVVYCRSDK